MLCSSIKGFAMPNCRLFHTIEKNILITVKNWWSLTYGQVYMYKKKREKYFTFFKSTSLFLQILKLTTKYYIDYIFSW
jgi:hypothetical protein